MRSLSMCATWLIFTAISLFVAFRVTEPLDTIIVWALALYGLQGFIAEVLGLRMSGTSITFPRRLASGLPLFVLWRARIRCADIALITSRPQAQVRVNKRSGERIKVIFANRAIKLLFFQFIKRANPSVEISR